LYNLKEIQGPKGVRGKYYIKNMERSSGLNFIITLRRRRRRRRMN
jgi:hypothetical protein